MAERTLTITLTLSDEDQAALHEKIIRMNEFITAQGGQFTKWTEDSEIRSIVMGGIAELRARHKRGLWRAHLAGLTPSGILMADSANLPEWLREAVHRAQEVQ